jgi:DNA-nicking Smr family endonuclease
LIKKISDKDKKDWLNFINNKEKLDNKDFFEEKKNKIQLEKSIDLHGYTLVEANKIIYEFILSSYSNSVRKIKVITGKGSRSKNKENPYQSESLGILKYSVPEYIKSNYELKRVIKDIKQSDIEDISKGSFDIFLKRFKE